MIGKLLCFLSQAETRAEFAERSVAKLEKTIDDLEGIQHLPTFFCQCIHWHQLHVITNKSLNNKYPPDFMVQL